MYFRNYGLRNTWRNKCLKIPVSDKPSTSNMVRGPNTVEILATLPLRYLLITVKAIELEKKLSVICKVIGMFCNVLTTYDKYSLLNRDNFRQPIQIHLSQKRKTFSQPVSVFLKARLNFEHLQ